MITCAVNMGGAVPLIVGKQIKAVAMLSRSRSPLMSDLPTANDQGLTDFDVVTWNAFFPPRGTPTEIVKTLSDATKPGNGYSGDQGPRGTTSVLLGPSGRSPPEYLAKFGRR